MKVTCKCKSKLIVRYVGVASGLTPFLQAWRDDWRMDSPPQAYDEPQPKAGEVDEVEIRNSLPAAIY